MKWSGSGVEPTRAHGDDAGFDLAAAEEYKVFPGGKIAVQTGVSVEFPAGWWGEIKARSSAVSRGFSVRDAVIDEGYRGELFVEVENKRIVTLTIEKGERIGQLVLHPTAPPMTVERADKLGDSERGTNGFGSSGV
jgi:dUTP pyrophosphatase